MRANKKIPVEILISAGGTIEGVSLGPDSASAYSLITRLNRGCHVSGPEIG